MEAILIVVFTIALVFGIIALAVLLNGLVLTVLWGWFIVPLFGLPALSLKSAMGLSLIIGYLTGGMRKDKDEGGDEKKNKYRDYMVLLNPLFVLLLGWIIYSC